MIDARHARRVYLNARLIGGDGMAVRMTRNAGMLLLAIWLIVTGIAGLAPLPIPGALMAALALIAGILILIGM